jgi:hypothetical protein
MEKYMIRFKKFMLGFAESMDALRVFPRIVLGLYLYGLYHIVKWYIEFELKFVTKCDSSSLNVLLKEGIKIDEAKSIACSVTEVIGHPTGYTALVTILVGASAAIFGMYAKSGRSWDVEKKKD